MWLSLFNLYRVIDMKHGKPSYNTIKNGSGLPIDGEFIKSATTFVTIFFRWLITYCPKSFSFLTTTEEVEEIKYESVNHVRRSAKYIYTCIRDLAPSEGGGNTGLNWVSLISKTVRVLNKKIKGVSQADLERDSNVCTLPGPAKGGICYRCHKKPNPDYGIIGFINEMRKVVLSVKKVKRVMHVNEIQQASLKFMLDNSKPFLSSKASSVINIASLSRMATSYESIYDSIFAWKRLMVIYFGKGLIYRYKTSTESNLTICFLT